MFVKCKPKRTDSGGLILPSYDKSVYPYHALLHGLSSVSVDGIEKDDEILSFVVSTTRSGENIPTNVSGVWTWKRGIGYSCTWVSKDGKNWVQTRNHASRYGYTELRVVIGTKYPSIVIEDGISGT